MGRKILTHGTTPDLALDPAAISRETGNHPHDGSLALRRQRSGPLRVTIAISTCKGRRPDHFCARTGPRGGRGCHPVQTMGGHPIAWLALVVALSRAARSPSHLPRHRTRGAIAPAAPFAEESRLTAERRGAPQSR
jgi:hypothetical protein